MMEPTTSFRFPALASAAVLSGCVVFPQGPREDGSHEPRGLALNSSEAVAVFLSTELSPADALPKGAAQPSPIDHPAFVTQHFMDGFRAARSDATLVAVDEALRKACIDTGTKTTFGAGRPVTLVPALDGADCRALIAARGIRYLVLVDGCKWTHATFVETVQVSFLGQQLFVFGLAARAIDTTTGAVACADRLFPNATRHQQQDPPERGCRDVPSV